MLCAEEPSQARAGRQDIGRLFRSGARTPHSSHTRQGHGAAACPGPAGPRNPPARAKAAGISTVRAGGHVPDLGAVYDQGTKKCAPWNKVDMKKTRPIPSSTELAAEACRSLGLRRKLPAALQKRLSGIRSMPTEATADKRAKPQTVRQDLVGHLLYAILPPENLRALMGLPDAQTAWNRWTGIWDLGARHARAWDNLMDALLYKSFEHPRLTALRKIAAYDPGVLPREFAWVAKTAAKARGQPEAPEERKLAMLALESRVRATRGLLARISEEADKPSFLFRLKAILVRFVVREMALREAAASLVWDLGTLQSVGPTVHLLPPADWLDQLLGGRVAGIVPKTTLQSWNAITDASDIKLHWSSIEQLVTTLSTLTNADAHGTALLQLRVVGHLVLRRLGLAIQHAFPNEHQQLSVAYTNQVRQFRSVMENETDGVSLGTLGNPKPDLMELALFGPMPLQQGAWMAEHIFRHTLEDRIEAATMQDPFWCVLLAAHAVPDDMVARHLLGSSDRKAKHPLGVTSLLSKRTLADVAPLLLEGGPV